MVSIEKYKNQNKSISITTTFFVIFVFNSILEKSKMDILKCPKLILLFEN